jgi:hypothetical protein
MLLLFRYRSKKYRVEGIKGRSNSSITALRGIDPSYARKLAHVKRAGVKLGVDRFSFSIHGNGYLTRERGRNATHCQGTETGLGRAAHRHSTDTL